MKRFIYSIYLILFVSYLSLLCYLLFLSAYRVSVNGLLTYNLVPFKTIVGYFAHFTHLSLTDQFVGNILAFVPFGFFLPLLSIRLRSSFILIVGLTFGSSLLVEVIQFFTRVGAFDVDDLLLNTIGGIVGYFLSRVYLSLFHSSKQKNRGCSQLN